MAALFRMQCLAPPYPRILPQVTLWLYFNTSLIIVPNWNLWGKEQLKPQHPSRRWINTDLPLEVVDGVFSAVFQPDFEVTPSQHITPLIFSISGMRQYLWANQNKMSVLDFSSMDTFRWFFEMYSYRFVLIKFLKRKTTWVKILVSAFFWA